MAINPKVRHVRNTIDHAKKVHNISSKMFFQKYDSNHDHQNMRNLMALTQTMNNVVKSTDKAMKGAKLAESRANARLLAVKKATSETVKYTVRAKHAAMTSKKAAQSAAITSKKMAKDQKQTKRLQKSYAIQIRAALTAAKESEKNANLALKSSQTARAAARISLTPKKI